MPQESTGDRAKVHFLDSGILGLELRTMQGLGLELCKFDYINAAYWRAGRHAHDDKT